MGKGKRKVRRREKKVAKPRAKNKTPLWKVEGGKVVRPNRACPKCGPGVFMANHVDRWSCGKCGYMKLKNEPPAQDGPKKKKQFQKARQE